MFASLFWGFSLFTLSAIHLGNKLIEDCFYIVWNTFYALDFKIDSLQSVIRSLLTPFCSGLDPAGPLFTKVDDIRFRLDPDDAGYVDVIHTDMPPRGTIFGLGMRGDAGHTDFFLNGGVRQPGCKKHEIDFGRLLCMRVKLECYLPQENAT